ncbi:MAG TPA: zinc-binding dehydrogenase [Solirubrobacteraceae bacterium]|nr:zinc-binding dehydrogenase [Solirubrobacteraceae bacterium]
MRAIVMEEFGQPGVLQLREIAPPEPGPGEALVRVRATFVALGRDVVVRSGGHPVFRKLVKLPHVLGGEHAGIVDAVGPGVSDDLVGARVAVSSIVYCGVCASCEASEPWDCAAVAAIGIQRPGSYAELTCVPVGNLRLLPDSVDFAQAAIFAANGPLASAQLAAGDVSAGTWVLVPGASGSLGTLLVALAARRGARVIATTRERRGAAALEELGAEVVLDTNDPELAGTLLKLTGRGVDVVVDNVALGTLWERYWPAVARRARVVFAGRAANSFEPLPVNIVELYMRWVTLTGVNMSDPRYIAPFWEQMRAAPIALPADLIATFPFESAAAVHAQIEQGRKLGHFVLTID